MMYISSINKRPSEYILPSPHQVQPRKINQPQDLAPYQFVHKNSGQQYVKKPSRKIKVIERILNKQKEQSNTECQCCQCRCFEDCQLFTLNNQPKLCICCQKQQDNIRQIQQIQSETNQSLCSCLNDTKQQQICGLCYQNICKQCKTNLCLKYNLCNSCKMGLCEECKKNLGIRKIIQLRRYPIRVKMGHQYHFQSCKCQRCQNLIKNNNKKVSEGPDHSEKQQFQHIKQGEPNQNKIQGNQIVSEK